MSDETNLRMVCANCDATFNIGISGGAFTLGENNFTNCTLCEHLNRTPVGTLTELKLAEPPIQPQRELRFNEAKPFSHNETDVLFGLKTNSLTQPVAAFLTNIRRLNRLQEIPTEVHLLSLVMVGSKVTNALQNAANKSVLPQDDDTEFIMLLLNALGSQGIDEARDQASEKTFKSLVSLTGSRLWQGMEAILTAQITGTWTAFEVLAGDLWEAALNVHPHSLSDLDKGKPQKRGGTASEKPVKQSSSSSDNEKMMRWTRFQEFNFDLSSKMGTLLKSRFDFSDIDDARDAYWSAFDSKEIRDCIDSECLKKLAKTRNLLVHRSGIIDKKFKNFMESLGEQGKFQVDSRFAVNGQVVNELIRPVLDVCFHLIQSVDQWIVDNPQPKKAIE